MDNLVKIFENAEFGNIRTVVIDGDPWFVGKDIAEALGYMDTNQAIRNHVDDDDKLIRQFNGSGQNREMYVINESGLYALVFGSKLPTAKDFKHWVTSEVLPAIRQTGGYQKPMSELEILAGSIKQLIEQNKRINALEEKQQIQSEQISSIKEVAAYHPDNEWRENTKKLINKMVDGNFEKIREIRKEAYNLLENRMSVLLETRLRNKRRRLLEEGVSRTKANELNIWMLLQMIKS